MKKTRERFSWFARKTLRTMTLLLAIGAAAHASAATSKTNPVTGAPESYTYNYTGSGAWTVDDWDPTPSAVPQASGSNVWDPLLIDGSFAVTAPSHVEGWSFRIGLFGGATLTVPYIRYWNGTAYAVVDSGSKLTIQSINTSDNWNATVNYYVAAAGGVTYTCAFNPTVTSAAIYNYNLKGAGSVVYEQAVGSGAHVVKMADVTLSGTSRVSSKTLVSFASSTPTFTAAADVKVYGTDGTTLKETVSVTSVRASNATIANTTSALTTTDAVGSCEIVQCTDGIVLYYVDGDPDAIVAKTYTPSININFTAGTALSTAADVGLGDYAVPGTSWNNLTVANNATLSSLNKVDSTGAASATTASVTITNTRGYWNCSSLAAASDLRAGYIDETADVTTPTVTVSYIPYDQYKVIVYTATDAANVAFGYVTINGTNYTYADDALTEGTTAWGASGAQNTAEALAEGVNVLVSPVVSGSTLTVIGHRSGSNPRGCIAAVQIVKVEQQVGENDLLIELDGDRTYTFDEAKAYSGTVYVTGSGTLTFAGTASTAATLHIGPAAAVNMVGSALTPAAVTGNGTAIYDGALPVAGFGWTDSSNWTGTVWLKNYGTGGDTARVGVIGIDSGNTANNVMNNWGNVNSSVKFTNVRGWCDAGALAWTLILEDDSTNYAWYNNNGYSGRATTFGALKGTGTLYDVGNTGCRQLITFTDASEFTGIFYVTGKRIGLGGPNTAENTNDNGSGTIEIVSGAAAMVASEKTWTTGAGFRIYGTFSVDGALASSATSAVKGSGTIVFTGRAPTPVDGENETKWWKNVNWTGTVEINGFTSLAGHEFNNYGNAGSTLRLRNCSGWLKNNYTCNPALEISGTFTWSEGSSGLENAFKVGTLKGGGTISIPTGGASTAVWQITDDWSGFTGAVVGNNTDGRRILVFGSTLPTTVEAGEIYVSAGATLNLGNASATWWTLGKGFVVDGTVVAPSRDKWGGGTAMTLGDTGVLELISTENTNESIGNSKEKNYSNVTGTGTIKFSSTAGWRTFPSTDAKMPATTLTIQTELADSLIITKAGETTIGNLAGSKNIRSDWNTSTSATRILTATQSKDTVWEGKFVRNYLNQLKVTGSGGTLTLAGTQDANLQLNVPSGGAVNLTGTWVGAATVSGTFGGTGTLTGALTFSDGATFKVFGTDIDGLSVSGAVTAGSEAAITVAIADGVTIDAETTILTATGSDITGTFALDLALAADYTLTREARVVKIAPKDKNIYAGDGVTVVGYMDGTTAIINNTSVAVTIPATATGVMVYPTSSQFTINATIAQLQSTDVKVVVGSGDSATSVSIASALDFDTAEYMNGNLVATLKNPAIGSASVDASLAPSLTVATTPGLWYGVVAGTSPDAMSVVSGTVSQAGAGETSKTFAAPAFSGTVQYYTVAVGVAESEFTE